MWGDVAGCARRAGRDRRGAHVVCCERRVRGRAGSAPRRGGVFIYTYWYADILDDVYCRRLEVLLADLQGFQANVDMLKRKPAGKMRSRGCAPVIIRNGRRLDLSEV